MRHIVLTRGYIALVDDADYDDLSGFNWQALVLPAKNTTKVYATRNIYEGKQEDGSYKQTQVSMHRQLMGFPPGVNIDHEDSNGLNNQRANLRHATNFQNAQNRNHEPRGTTKYLGVFYHDPKKYPQHAKKPYKAHININRKRIHLGYFTSAEDAARVRDLAALEHHGEFASLNFPL